MAAARWSRSTGRAAVADLSLAEELGKIERELAAWPKPNKMLVRQQECAPNCARNRIIGEGIERAPAGDCDCGAAYGCRVEE